MRLERARQELERGHLKQALKLAWDVGLEAADRADVIQLEQTEEVAHAIEERTSGRLGNDARMLGDYCAGVRANPQARGTLWSSLVRPQSSRGEATKSCPDCAERVKAAARVCRFCGHRFERTRRLD